VLFNALPDFDRRPYFTGVGTFVAYVIVQFTWLGSWAVTFAIWRCFRRGLSFLQRKALRPVTTSFSPNPQEKLCVTTTT
jgi:hypothetical protein